jgi:hypothetical protein
VSNTPPDFIVRGGIVSLTNATITGNAAEQGGGLFTEDSGSSTLTNSIVASNTAGSDCSGSMASLGHNLDSDGTCGLSSPGDLTNTEPLLGQLTNNGGATLTHALLPGSPAIDAGDPNACPATDQRGIARPSGTACDIGAFESTLSPQAGTITVVKDAVPDDPALFAFAVTTACPPFPCSGFTFNLDDGPDATYPTSLTFGAEPGVVSIQESSVPSGWTTSDITCSDGSPVDLPSRTAAIDLSPTEKVTCKFTSTPAAIPAPVPVPVPGATPAELPAGGGRRSALGPSMPLALVGLVLLSAASMAGALRLRRR